MNAPDMNAKVHEQFEVGDEPRIEIGLPAGDVRLIPGEPGAITVRVDSGPTDRLTITQRGDTVVVTAEKARRSFRGSFDVTATVPPGTDADIRLASADLGIDVDLGGLRVSLASGDMRARDVSGDVVVKTASGDVRLGTVGGRLEVASASGDLRAAACDDLHVSAASGDVSVKAVRGRAQVRTAAGDVSIRRFDGPHFEGKSLSGDVRLGIPPGKEVDVDVHSMSGDVRSEFPSSPVTAPSGDRCSVRVRSLSGDVLFRPAD
jgi:hypothetical protein